LFNNINKTEKDEAQKKTLDKGFIMENVSQLADENSQLSKKVEENIYHINKRIETNKSNYLTTIGNNNISYRRFLYRKSSTSSLNSVKVTCFEKFCGGKGK
jgi:hypothetical protein